MSLHRSVTWFFDVNSLTMKKAIVMCQCLTIIFFPALRTGRLGRCGFNKMAHLPITALQCKNWFNDNSPNSWIGRLGSIKYSPCSPNLTPPDFLFWDMLKNSVYSKKLGTKDHLMSMIVKSCKEISEDLCQGVCYSVVQRTAKCIEKDSQHFEHLLR